MDIDDEIKKEIEGMPDGESKRAVAWSLGLIQAHWALTTAMIGLAAGLIVGLVLGLHYA